jgi:hypothetical protein
VVCAERAAAFAPESRDVRINLGYFLAQAGRIEDARVQWLKVSGTQGPFVPWARTNLLALEAVLHQESNRLDWILAHAEAPLVRSSALVNEAIRRWERGEHSEAHRFLSQAREEVGDEAMEHVIDEIEYRWSRPPAPTFDGWTELEAATHD